jgi:hypothetical protein
VIFGIGMLVLGLVIGDWRASRRARDLVETTSLAVVPSAEESKPAVAGPSAEVAKETAPAKRADSPASQKQRPREVAKSLRPTESAKPGTEIAATVVTFENDVLPILQAKCISCHGGLSKKGELDLRTLASAKRGGESGSGIRPGSLDESTIWNFISRDKMPPAKSKKLTEAEKTTIRNWIVSGAK